MSSNVSNTNKFNRFNFTVTQLKFSFDFVFCSTFNYLSLFLPVNFLSKSNVPYGIFLFPFFLHNFLIVEALCLRNDMQWHRPVSSSSMTTQSIHKSSTNNKPTIPISKQMNSSMPFRELLLQQQQNKMLIESSKNSLDSLTSTTTTNSSSNAETNAIISSVEQDRIALASHFQERDRLILQHQQHQLQRKQKHKQQQQLDEQHEKPFSSSNRIGEFVIGGVDRATNIASGKSGKLTYIISNNIFLSIFLSFFLALSGFRSFIHGIESMVQKLLLHLVFVFISKI